MVVLLASDTELILAEGKKTHDPTIGANTATLIFAIAELCHIRCATLERLAKCLPYIFVLHLRELGLTISVEELWTECLEDFEILPLLTLVLRLTLRSNIRTVLRSPADGSEIILAYHGVERKSIHSQRQQKITWAWWIRIIDKLNISYIQQTHNMKCEQAREKGTE